ncbi:hypothetical protein WG906_15435 [Pedobacter sp. P351]|uniref:tetratricopeptide repeat protein n=1 Tax=Pedobacter superstes TaxID=3133441 RepID=UPI0030B6D2DF
MSMYSMEDIARFAEGDMKGEELIQFENALKTDKDLQANLAFYQNVHSSLKMKLVPDLKDQEFKASLSEISENYFRKETKVISMRRYLAWTSAIAAVFVLFLIWAPWDKNLYRQYADTNMLAMAERGDKTEEQMQKAADAFNKKDFSSAKKALEKVNKVEPENAMAQYYFAITLLETGEIQKSRKVLDEIFNGTSIFKYDAAFYMALSFLKEKDEQQSISWLKKIPADSDRYKKSQELLNKLL